LNNNTKNEISHTKKVKGSTAKRLIGQMTVRKTKYSIQKKFKGSTAERIIGHKVKAPWPKASKVKRHKVERLKVRKVKSQKTQKPRQTQKAQRYEIQILKNTDTKVERLKDVESK